LTVIIVSVAADGAGGIDVHEVIVAAGDVDDIGDAAQFTGLVVVGEAPVAADAGVAPGHDGAVVEQGGDEGVADQLHRARDALDLDRVAGDVIGVRVPLDTGGGHEVVAPAPDLAELFLDDAGVLLRNAGVHRAGLGQALEHHGPGLLVGIAGE